MAHLSTEATVTVTTLTTTQAAAMTVAIAVRSLLMAERSGRTTARIADAWTQKTNLPRMIVLENVGKINTKATVTVTTITTTADAHLTVAIVVRSPSMAVW